MMLQETFAYDPNDHLERHTRHQGRVNRTYMNDIMGRLTFVSTDNASVGAGNGSVDETTNYNSYASGTITKTNSTGLISRMLSGTPHGLGWIPARSSVVR
ncbi:MAG: hypothetical protein QOI24_4474 [Acidobacteriota bacterium]|nr:hypothetical protein [Acidobacteriota bacterium]